MYKKIVKPAFDFAISIFLIIALSPLIFITIVFLAIANKGKIFFVQLRPGLYGKPFKIIKFKTMKDLYDENGILLPDELRLTKVGRFVRSSSIDELLQLINVIKGEMSIVGPRPLLMQYLSRYTTEQARRHDVKPGITGLAQVKGRNSINWEEKFQLDIEYVNNQNLLMDLNIICKTIKNVFLREGISSNGHATMEEFKGNY